MRPQMGAPDDTPEIHALHDQVQAQQAALAGADEQIQRLEEQNERLVRKLHGHHNHDLDENEEFYRCLICEHIDALDSNPAKRPT